MSKEPNRNVYVGNRYVPKIMGEWDNSIDYEGLSIVTHQGTSYTSKKRVPVGIDILNEEFWVVTGNYDAQVEYYRQDVLDVKKQLPYFVKRLQTTETYNIPTDYPTLQKAINELSKTYSSHEVSYILNIESGHKIKTGLSLYNGDYSKFIIKSFDDVVYVHDDFTGDLIAGNNAIMPVLDCLIDMNDKGSNGINLKDGSKMFVKSSGNGVRNAGGTCLITMFSEFRASYADFSGGNDRTGWFTRSSVVSVPECNFNNCKGGYYAVYVSRASIVDLSNSTINNSQATESALYVLRSMVTFIVGEANNSLSHGVVASQNSLISARNSTANNSGKDGFRAIDGSTIDCNSTTANNCGGSGYMVSTSGRINASYGRSNKSRTGVLVSNGGSINVGEGVINESIVSDLVVYSGSSIYATNLETTNGKPNVKDTNLKEFNVNEQNGIIYDSNYEPEEKVLVESDIITFTTTGFGERNISHSLGRTPDTFEIFFYGETLQPYIIQIKDRDENAVRIIVLDPMTGETVNFKELTVYYKVVKNL